MVRAERCLGRIRIAPFFPDKSAWSLIHTACYRFAPIVYRQRLSWASVSEIRSRLNRSTRQAPPHQTPLDQTQTLLWVHRYQCRCVPRHDRRIHETRNNNRNGHLVVGHRPRRRLTAAHIFLTHISHIYLMYYFPRQIFIIKFVR